MWIECWSVRSKADHAHPPLPWHQNVQKTHAPSASFLTTGRSGVQAGALPPARCSKMACVCVECSGSQLDAGCLPRWLLGWCGHSPAAMNVDGHELTGAPSLENHPGGRATCPKVAGSQPPQDWPPDDQRVLQGGPSLRRALSGTTQPLPCLIPPPHPFLLGPLPQQSPASSSASGKRFWAMGLLTMNLQGFWGSVTRIHGLYAKTGGSFLKNFIGV